MPRNVFLGAAPAPAFTCCLGDFAAVAQGGTLLLRPLQWRCYPRLAAVQSGGCPPPEGAAGGGPTGAKSEDFPYTDAELGWVLCWASCAVCPAPAGPLSTTFEDSKSRCFDALANHPALRPFARACFHGHVPL